MLFVGDIVDCVWHNNTVFRLERNEYLDLRENNPVSPACLSCLHDPFAFLEVMFGFVLFLSRVRPSFDLG